MRIKRHNRIVEELVKYIKKYGWTIYVEPSIKDEAGKLWIPDLIVAKEQQIIVIDVTVRSDLQINSLEGAWDEKTKKYQHLEKEIMDLIDHSAVVSLDRGLSLSTSDVKTRKGHSIMYDECNKKIPVINAKAPLPVEKVMFDFLSSCSSCGEGAPTMWLGHRTASDGPGKTAYPTLATSWTSFRTPFKFENIHLTGRRPELHGILQKLPNQCPVQPQYDLPTPTLNALTNKDKQTNCRLH
ncbi:uncharacterized protein LOC132810819 [Hemiscyllium ocellatum]|uniref:uncharacterized protein LOC132810819 n=1 Tax=Hemiscyllium ocellatum TaxID=170820 RepID=UPI002965F6FD|nr:uncharacterized protein LOC132810819 [Hemiscyllium ocellatum]